MRISSAFIAEHAHIDIAEQRVLRNKHKDAVIRRALTTESSRNVDPKTTALRFAIASRSDATAGRNSGQCAQRSALAFSGCLPRVPAPNHIVSLPRSRSAWLFLRYPGQKSSAERSFPAAAYFSERRHRGCASGAAALFGAATEYGTVSEAASPDNTGTPSPRKSPPPRAH